MVEQFDPRSTGGDPKETTQFSAIGAQLEQPLADRTLRTEELAAIQALPAGSALLISQSGPNSGARFLLDAEVTNAGRHQRSDIFLDDVTVSRRHAQFLRIPGGYKVRDSGSLNGTYVNRERVDEAVLQVGDEIQIGKFRLTYYTSPATA
ncbi:Forkhead associated (FHA) domain, binds pSer, pThr, pTyr [Actinobaculum suis]|uniref:FHA domain-containing protein n=1 Tax=Actinobaculum suis TaxID=1657 RepID=A0A1G7C033_9ACTO|nr:FHA domain-containing protein [Actinobaculum suis]MDY5153111.1 FHA domain-containing protein [Actinobaculum suis]SDE32714.1 Forkhead associated (FHA) domain, binds pSer, pThr, pTyr [Actinobaculum suis]